MKAELGLSPEKVEEDMGELDKEDIGITRSIGGVYYVRGVPQPLRNNLLDALKQIRKAVNAVHMFSSKEEENRHFNELRALREINDILEGAGIIK